MAFVIQNAERPELFYSTYDRQGVVTWAAVAKATRFNERADAELFASSHLSDYRTTIIAKLI